MIVILSLLICISSVTDAQELSNEEIKAIKKECKKLKKEGWKPKPDASFDVQLTDLYKIKKQNNESGDAKWQVGNGSSIGTIYDSTRDSTIHIAEMELVRLFLNKVNVQLNIGEWIPIIEQTTRPVILFEAYRDMPNGHIEVMLHVGILTDKMYELLCHANTVPAL